MTQQADPSNKLPAPSEGGHNFVRRLHMHRPAFYRTMSCFSEEDSQFRPRPDMLSVAGQVLHVANSNDFVLSGLFGAFEGVGPAAQWDKGFTNMSWREYANSGNFTSASEEMLAAKDSLKLALGILDRSLQVTIDLLSKKSLAEIMAPLPPNPLFPTADLIVVDVLESMLDHIAHHRGALAQYARLLGKEPQLPYFDMPESFHEQMVLDGMTAMTASAAQS